MRGIPYIIDYTSRLFPPDFSILERLIPRVKETIQIAILGTTFGAAIAFPLSFLAAQNIVHRRLFYQFIRTFFDFCRGINEIVWALIFVSMVGLGPFPGVLALTVHLTGALGKYFSEAIENVNQDIIDAMKSTGANKYQNIYHGVIPQVQSLFIGFTFYYFEHSIRAASILGLVGAGGIGIELLTSIKLFKYGEISTILIVMVVLVTVIDRTSAFIRNKVIKG
jgi:phosphonate transport system permease protein